MNKSKNPFMSIIVPVYNVEKYLEECVGSIISQSFSDFELILVDDGSTDSSPKMCDGYAEKDNRVKVIHKQNGGLSSARNAGIDEAEGEYVLFVDSDDYIAEGSLMNIYDTVCKNGDCDVVFLDANKVFEDKGEIPLGDGYQKDKIDGMDKASVMKYLAYLPKFPGAAWSKLVKRDVILKNNLYFEYGIFCEDIDWTISLLLCSNRFAYCEGVHYYYRQNRAGSITNRIGLKNVKDLLHIIEKHALRKHEFREEVNAFLAYEYMLVILMYARLNEADKAAVYNEIAQYKWLLGYARQRKTKLCAAAVRVVGIKNTSKLLNLCYMRRKG